MRLAPRRGLPCFSIAGDPSIEDVCWPLQRLHAAMTELEGPNDGLVSVESALAFGTPLPHWPVDHFRQMNWIVADPGPRASARRSNSMPRRSPTSPASASRSTTGAPEPGPLTVPGPIFDESSAPVPTSIASSTPGDPGILQLDH